jgi:hypothetical protein
MHGGPKSPLRWEWIPIPIPKYPTPGVKVVRLLTDQQGFAIAYASVSALTPSAPREPEVTEIDKARPRRREEPRAPAAEKELTGLVAYWPLDEGSGASTAERAGRINPGALQGRPAWTAGRWGRALRFDGGDSWVDLPGVPALNNLTEGSFTISVWFQPDDVPSGKEPTNNAAYAIVVREGWHQGIGYGNDGSFFLSQYFCRRDDESKPLHVNAGTKSFPAGVFHHLACGLDREARRLFIYVDGNLEGTTIVDATLKAWKYPAPWRLGIGAPGGAENRWCAKGVIDDVRFYNRALSPTEVQALFRTPH